MIRGSGTDFPSRVSGRRAAHVLSGAHTGRSGSEHEGAFAMVRRNRLTAALAALTVPWLAPQMGCSQFPLFSPSEPATSSPVQARVLTPAAQKYLAEPPPIPPAGNKSPSQPQILLIGNGQPGQPSVGKDPPNPVLPALPGDSGWVRPPDKPLPELPTPGFETSDHPLPINLAAAPCAGGRPTSGDRPCSGPNLGRRGPTRTRQSHRYPQINASAIYPARRVRAGYQ